MADVQQWLDSLGLGEYADAFKAERVDLETLPELTDEDLKGLGLPLGPRRKILRAARSSPASPTSSGSPSTEPDGSLSPGRPELSDERKLVTVLFADVVGSTALVDGLDPEDAHARLRPALDAMMGAVKRHEGTVNRVQGDGIMALFGAPLAHEDHAARACRAALAMQRAVGDIEELRIRVGLHSGPVLVHTIRNDLTVEYEAEGPTVHLAARLESLATPGGVLMTQATRDLAGAAIDVKPAGDREAKGIAEPIATFELIAAPEDRSRWQVAAARGLTVLAGRDNEREVISRAATQAARGDGQALLVVGDPGIGKSRLLHEAREPLAGGEWRFVGAATTPYHRYSTYHTARALVASMLEVDLSAHPDELATLARSRIVALDAALSDATSALLSVLGAPNDDPGWQRRDPAQRRRLTIDAVRRLFMRIAEDGPMAVLVEDLHWLDPGSQEVLDALVEGLASARCLALFSSRPGYSHGWAQHGWFTQIPLLPLDAATASTMLDSLLAEGEREVELRARILERAGGTPLFIEETVRSLLDVGALAGAPGALHVTGPVDAVDIPASVQAVIAARIDRLDARARSVLQAASVIGAILPAAVLEHVVGDEMTDLGEAVTALLGAELMTEQRVAPSELGFRHALVRDVAYESLPRERRRTLHARAGAAFEELLDGSVHASLDVVAEHYRRGEQWDRAAPMARRAAVQAKDRYEHGRALALGQIALECAQKTGGGNTPVIDAHILIGDMQGLTGDLDAANRTYDAALALEPAPDVERRIRNRRHLSRVATRERARLSYSVNGNNPETIVFVIPVAYGRLIFQPTIELLCDSFRLVTPEPRGEGRSDPVSDAFTFSDWVDDVAAVIEHLDAGPVHLVGQSRGGMVALRLANRRPELVKSLVLIGLRRGLAAYSSMREEAAEDIAAGNAERLARELSVKVFSESDSTDLIEQVVRATCAMAPETTLWFSRTFPDFDASELSPTITTRTLIVHGTEDIVTPFEDGRIIAGLMPNAVFRPFPGRGHLPNFTARAEFCEVVTAFVRGDTVPGAVAVRE